MSPSGTPWRKLAGALLAVAATLMLAPPSFGQADPLANCKYYTRTQQDFAQGLPYCEEAIRLYPEDPEARFFGGWCLAEMGRFADAWESFSWLFERRDSGNKKLRKLAKWAEERAKAYYREHFNHGVELITESDTQETYREARDEFLIATQIYPLLTDAHLNLGFTLTQLGDLEGALEAFRRAVEIDPESETALGYYSDALGRKLAGLRSAEEPDSALIGGTRAALRETLLQLLEKNPTQDAALLQLGDLEFAEGNNDRAIEYVKKAIEINSENVVNLYNVGVKFYQSDQYDPASEAFKFVCSFLDNPDDELWRDARYNLALSYYNGERYEECVPIFEEILERDRENKDNYLNLGKAYMKLGDTEKATEYLEKFEELKNKEVVGE